MTHPTSYVDMGHINGTHYIRLANGSVTPIGLWRDPNDDYDVYRYETCDGRERKAKLRLRKWARGLHGNAPSGTPYGTLTVTLSDTAKANLVFLI